MVHGQIFRIITWPPPNLNRKSSPIWHTGTHWEALLVWALGIFTIAKYSVGFCNCSDRRVCNYSSVFSILHRIICKPSLKKPKVFMKSTFSVLENHSSLCKKLQVKHDLLAQLPTTTLVQSATTQLSSWFLQCINMLENHYTSIN